MRPKIVGIESIDISLADFSKYLPDDPECFAFDLTLEIGVADNVEGSELFSLIVCTPKWIEKCYLNDDQPMMLGRHRLIVLKYDWEKILAFLEHEVAKCEGDTWEEVTDKVGRIALYEYEDLRIIGSSNDNDN